MTVQTDPTVRITNRIARRTVRIAEWDKQTAEIEPWWNGALAYRRFCEAMSSAARSKKADLEAELQQLQSE